MEETEEMEETEDVIDKDIEIQIDIANEELDV